MEERDELEIETRLRAALLARSELVTHSTLRPGIPPNEHTAGARSRRESWWSRRFWVPVTVAAALAGGVFVGAQLPSGSGSKVSAGASAGVGTEASTSGITGGSPTQSAPGATGATPVQNATTPGTAAKVGTLGFTLADGWQLTALSDTSGCVTPKSRPAPAPAAAGVDALPCGVDALYLDSGAVPTAWPLSTATKATGWWPGQASSASDIACPAAKPGSGDTVTSSVLLRSSAEYPLAAPAGQAAHADQPTAEYHEWAVTCEGGAGVQPMLWQLNPAPGDPAPAAFSVAAAVSADPRYDSALLGMVGSLHQAS